MTTTVSRVGLLVLTCVVLTSCSGGSEDAAPAAESEVTEGAPATVESDRDDPAESGEGGAETLEFTGSVTSTGTEGMRMVNLRADDGSSVGLVGDLAAELARLSGAVVTVRGIEAPAPASRGLDVTEYVVESVNGETPSVGVLERRDGEYWLGGDPDIHLIGVPDALSQALGAKLWVTGPSGADGVTVQSYGIIRPN